MEAELEEELVKLRFDVRLLCNTAHEDQVKKL